MKWKEAKLEDVALQVKGAIVSGPFGSNIGSRFFVDEGIPVIRGNNLTFGETKFVDDGFVFLTEEKAQEFRNCEAIANDLVFTAAGTIGQVGIIPDNAQYQKYIISNKQLRVRCDSERADAVFLYYWFTTGEMRHHIMGQNRGCSIPLINLSVLRNLPIPNPPLATQRRIASILSAYDELIENNRRRIVLLEQAARLRYEEWFVRLKFPGHERTRVVNGVPEGWERKRLGDVARVNERTLPGSYQGEIEYVDIASVTPGNIGETTSYDFQEAPSRARRIARHGDIIWSCVRPNRRSHAIVWHPPDNLVASTGFAVITPMAMPTAYLYFAVTTPEFVGYLENRATGVAYPAVLSGDFESAAVVVSPPGLLGSFNEFTQPMLDQMHNLRNQNQKLRAARDLLLPRLMSGEIAV